jgi:NMD protein affecting ribosome stability and mRNA decay
MKLIPISRELCVGDIIVDKAFDAKRVYSVIDVQGERVYVRHLGTLNFFENGIDFPAQETVGSRKFHEMEPHVLQF